MGVVFINVAIIIVQLQIRWLFSRRISFPYEPYRLLHCFGSLRVRRRQVERQAVEASAKEFEDVLDEFAPVYFQFCAGAYRLGRNLRPKAKDRCSAFFGEWSPPTPLLSSEPDSINIVLLTELALEMARLDRKSNQALL